MADPPVIEAHKPHFHRDEPWKVAVRCATTGAITIATGLNVGDTIDGVTLADGDRVLVKDQSSGYLNGIYVAGATPARAFDMDASTEILGAVIFVVDGTANGGKIFKCTNTVMPLLGTTVLNFAAVSSGTDLSAIDFLVGTASGLLSGEIVVGTTPGGELGGTWASPTVDARHSGSTHRTFAFFGG